MDTDVHTETANGNPTTSEAVNSVTDTHDELDDVKDATKDCIDSEDLVDGVTDFKDATECHNKYEESVDSVTDTQDLTYSTNGTNKDYIKSEEMADGVTDMQYVTDSTNGATKNHTDSKGLTDSDVQDVLDYTNHATKDDGEDTGSAKVEIDMLEKIRPKQQIGLLGAIAFGMGSIIGSGIFVSPTGALKNTGSMGASLLAWGITGLITMVQGLMYGELATLVPRSGGEYTYIDEGMGSLPAFIAATIQPLISHTASIATLSLVLSNYLCAPIFDECGPPDSIRKTIAATVIVTVAVANSVSVKFAERAQILFTVLKFAALCLISIGGIVHLARGNSVLPSNAFEGSETSVSSYVLAIYTCSFAYSGIQSIVMITEEIKEPKKNIPRAIIITLLTVTLIYVVTNLSYFIMLDRTEFLASNAVAYSWAEKAINPVKLIIPISVVFSVFGAINGGLFGAGRVLFAAARAGHLPEVMSYLHFRSFIPTFSICTLGAIGLICLIPGNVGQLIHFLTTINTIIILLTSISVLLIRWRRHRDNIQNDESVFSTPIVIPILSVLIALFLIIAPLALDPKLEFLFAIATAVGSFVLYFPFIYFKLKLPGIDSVTTGIQLLMNLCPTEGV